MSVVGYESLELKGAGIATYDPDQDIISFDAASNYLELVDGAKISFGGKLESRTFGRNVFASGDSVARSAWIIGDVLPSISR